MNGLRTQDHRATVGRGGTAAPPSREDVSGARPGAARAQPSPGEVMRLQRAIGNRAVSGLLERGERGVARRAPVRVTPRDGGAANALQRAVILLDVSPDDYALQKVLTGLDPANLRLIEREDQVWDLDTAAGEKALIPYAKLGEVSGIADEAKEQLGDEFLMQNAEDVYLVGHGAVGGRVWTAPNHGGEIGDFSSIANTIKAMAGPAWAGTIRVLTCNSSVRSGHAHSVVEKIGEEWGNGAPNVTGQGGFAYGMGTHMPGQMAVLKGDFDSLYKGDQYDDATAAHLLEKAEEDDANATLINFTPGDNNLYPTESDRKHGAWDSFVLKMNAIQASLNTIVTDPANANAVQGLDILAKARVLQTHAAFQAKIQEQHALFAAFDLWA